MTVAYETKVILNLLALQIAKASSLAEAYAVIKMAADAEGIKLPSTREELLQSVEKGKEEEN